MHAAPGVYAVLLGSGVSTAAGILTGWQVVQDLIRQVAVAEGADLDEVALDAEAWWSNRGYGDARYDTILEALAPTDAMRQAILRRYFDPVPGEPVESSAHDALAELCATGRIRLILTTNFDRLMEHALDRAGVPSQVITDPSAVAGMIPLTHAGVTIVKLHGDYASPGLRNTPDELALYPPEWQALLARVFDEFGIVVVGWSAEWDVALRRALNDSPSRRYPAYWATYQSSVTEAAARLIQNRGANVITTAGAAEFLEDLAQRISRLDDVAKRRNRPTYLRSYRFPPQGTPQDGWAVVPPLQLRAVASIEPVTADDSGIIRPEQREALVAGLDTMLATELIRDLNQRGKSFAEPVDTSAWAPTPGAYQSTEYCSYRLGGDATEGASALLSVRLPSFGQTGASVVVYFDVGLAISDKMRLDEAARILSAGLIATTSIVPLALADLLPMDADVGLAELHICAADLPSAVYNASAGTSPLTDRLDLSSLGTRERPASRTLGFSAQIPGPLADQQATELTVEAINYMALADGWLDPRDGIRQLRIALGLAAPPS